MIKYLLVAAALIAAGVPAAVGTVGNASFSRDLPVRVPETAQTRSPSPSVGPGADDDGTPDQGHGDAPGTVPSGGPADDHGHHAEPGDDHGHHAEPGDDHGGDRGPGGGTSDDSGGSGGHGSDDD